MTVRLLGPCFKTGQAEAFHQQICAKACWHRKKTSWRTICAHTNITKHMLQAHKCLYTHAIQPPTGIIPFMRMHVQMCKKLAHKARIIVLRPHHSVKQAPQSHPSKSNLFTFSSANTNSFNSLFKVLFIFPSWYLFAISLNNILIFTWNLPPTLHSNAEECDSSNIYRARRTANDKKDSHPHWRFLPIC